MITIILHRIFQVLFSVLAIYYFWNGQTIEGAAFLGLGLLEEILAEIKQ